MNTAPPHLDLENLFQEYHILRQWYLDIEKSPTPVQLLHFDNENYCQLIQHELKQHQPLTEEQHDAWSSALQPILKQSIAVARLLCNTQLQRSLETYHSNASVDKHLTVQTSTIATAGMGLFNSTSRIVKGTVVCYYSGLIHNYKSKSEQVDQSYILYVGYSDAFDEDIFIDGKPVLAMKARYMNDPLNASMCNVKWDTKTKAPPAGNATETDSSSGGVSQCVLAIIATVDIEIGEEIFIAYGDNYWNSSEVIGTVMKKQ